MIQPHFYSEFIRVLLILGSGITMGAFLLSLVWTFVWLIGSRKPGELIKGYGVFALVGGAVGLFAGCCVL